MLGRIQPLAHSSSQRGFFSSSGFLRPHRSGRDRFVLEDFRRIGRQQNLFPMTSQASGAEMEVDENNKKRPLWEREFHDSRGEAEEGNGDDSEDTPVPTELAPPTSLRKSKTHPRGFDGMHEDRPSRKQGWHCKRHAGKQREYFSAVQGDLGHKTRSSGEQSDGPQKHCLG